MAEERKTRTKIVSVTRKKDQTIIDEARKSLILIFWGISSFACLFLLVGVKMRLL